MGDITVQKKERGRSTFRGKTRGRGEQGEKRASLSLFFFPTPCRLKKGNKINNNETWCGQTGQRRGVVGLLCFTPTQPAVRMQRWLQRHSDELVFLTAISE